jgi:hypothetical protein
MKISYRTNPILEKIEKGKLGKVKIYEYDYDSFILILEELKETWANYSRYFKQNIKYITKPFEEAIKTSYDKLATEEMFSKTESTYGTLVIGDRTICYYLDNYSQDFWNLVVFEFIGDFIIRFHSDLELDDMYVSKSVIKQNIVTKNDVIKHTYSGNGYLFLILNFIKYAEIKVKEVGAGKRVKDINCKYVNDIKSNVQILDSTWFTTLVKSEGFKVRGHFRLQPCGQGMKDRKLIWINDFEKEGYIRHFKRPVNIDY